MNTHLSTGLQNDFPDYPQHAIVRSESGCLFIFIQIRSAPQPQRLIVQKLDANGDRQLPSVGGLGSTIASGNVRSVVATPNNADGMVIAYHLDDHVYARVIQASGTSTVPVQLSTISNQLAPRIASDGAGGAIVAWVELDSGQSRVRCRHVLADGSIDPAWPTGLVVASATSPQSLLDLRIAHDANAGAILGWRLVHSSSSVAMAARVAANGNVPWTTSVSPSAPINVQDLRLTSDSAGNGYFAALHRTNSTRTVITQKLDLQGNRAWGPAGVLTLGPAVTGFDNTSSPFAIAPDGVGGAVVVANHRGFSSSSIPVIGQRVIGSSTPQLAWGGNVPDQPQIVSTNVPGFFFANSSPKLLVDYASGYGRVFVTWSASTDARFGLSDIHAQRLDLATGSKLWGNTSDFVLSSAVGNQYAPAAVNAGGCQWIVAFGDARAGGGFGTTASYCQIVREDPTTGPQLSADPCACAVPVAITLPPQPRTACVGDPVSLSVTANGTSPSYQWFRNSTLLAGATSATLTFPSVAESDAGLYYVRVSNTCGSDTSAPVQLTVNVAPTVLSWPVDPTTACAGDIVSLSYQIGGSPLPDYELQHDGATIRSGTATSTSLNFNLGQVTTSNSGPYTLTLEDPSGACPSHSRTIQLNVATPATITQQLPREVRVCDQGVLDLSIVAQGDPTLRYTWFFNGQQIPGATTASYRVDPVGIAQAGTYRVEVENDASVQCGSASSEATVYVLTPPPNVVASDGTSLDHVEVSWSAIAGALGYRVFRRDNTFGASLQDISGLVNGTVFIDAGAQPGHPYYYSVRAYPDAAGQVPCPDSILNEGHRQLECPSNVTASSGLPDPYVSITWDPVQGASFYRVLRAESDDLNAAQPISNWVQQEFWQDASALEQRTYYYWAQAAIDGLGRNPGALCQSVTGWKPRTPPGASCGPGISPAPGLLILIDQSRHMGGMRAGSNRTRWEEAVEAAKADLRTFFAQCAMCSQGPGDLVGSAAIWTFSGASVRDLTNGFVSESQASLVLDTLPSSPSPLEGANLADALHESLSALCFCFFGTGSQCPTFVPSIPTAATDRVLSIHTAGIEDSSSGRCSGPPAMFGSSCGNYQPANSWQARVCNFFSVGNPCTAILVREWGSATASSPISTMQNFASLTGGAYARVLDNGPLPSPQFDDCNGNGVVDLTDIALGTSLDCNQNLVPDECENIRDCNGNNSPDICDIANGTSPDANGNGAPDECEGFATSAPPTFTAGVTNSLFTVNASPNAIVFYLFGLSRSTTTLPCTGAPTVGIDLNGAFPLAALADAQGVSRLDVDIPTSMLGMPFLVQGIELVPSCQTSDVLNLEPR